MTDYNVSLANQIAQDFERYLDAWHGSPETYDDELDAQIHRWYADVLTNRQRKVWPPRNMPYFSPSSANACPRSLYEKLTGAKKDVTVTPPFQGRWTRIGTAIGDIIQRDLIFAEKHGSGTFKFERNEHGEPVFEDFAKVSNVITHNGKTFALFGTCDGIMRYISEDGEVLRVGLEIKSKQTTYAQTSDYSTRNGPKEDHVKQAVCYSIMYGVDYYVLLYVNASKKSWMMTPDEFAKSRDIKAFGLYITDEMRAEVLDSLAGIVDAVDTRTAPTLDLDKWTFNGFKRACALSLTDEEYEYISRKVAFIQRSSLPDYKKREPMAALEFIERVRAEEQAKGAA